MFVGGLKIFCFLGIMSVYGNDNYIITYSIAGRLGRVINFLFNSITDQ
jgi:hypothetical protein